MIKPAIKSVLTLSLLGLVILAACSRSPMHEQANSTAPVTNAPAINLDGAIAEAKSANKLVFMDFTGSDWCPECIELRKKVFSTPEFQTYADANLVKVIVDFPEKFRLPADAAATNDLLSAKFKVEGYPTLVALDGSGKEIWRHLGGFDALKDLTNELAAAKSKAR
jgi:thioredoxin-related protein